MVSVLGVVVYAGIFLFLVVAGIIGCGNPYSSTLLGRASYFLQATLPSAISGWLNSIGAAWVQDAAFGMVRMCCLQRNPVVQIGYCILTFGGFIVFIVLGYPRIPNAYMAAWHKPIGIVVMLVCVASFLLASFADPGMVKPGERKAAAAKRGGKPAKRGKAKGSKGLEASAAGAPTSGKHPKKTDKSDPDDIADCEAVPADPSFCTLPFDGALYEGPAVCRTCGVVKPPRSKHCNMMGGCVARFDHYCVWLNAAVGERTYRWFLLYLISHTVVLLYGAVACASIFLSEIEEHRMLERTFVNTRTGEEIPASYGIIFQFLMSSNPELMMIQVLCAVMGVVLVGFTGYHIMLTATNMTTNETFKYSALPNKVRHRARVRQYVERRREAAGLPPTRRTAEQDRAEELAAAAPPVNPFDRGMLANFAEVIWPLSLRSAEEWPRIEYGQPPALDAETLAAQGADAKDIDELVVQELRQRAAARK